VPPLVECGQRNMGGHHALDSGLDGGAKGLQLDRVEALPGSGRGWKVEMGVDIGVAMPREVLHHGEHPVILNAFDRCGHELAYDLRILTKRAKVDDGICRVAVDIRHR
jgi:hypothetical protein